MNLTKVIGWSILVCLWLEFLAWISGGHMSHDWVDFAKWAIALRVAWLMGYGAGKAEVKL